MERTSLCHWAASRTVHVAARCAPSVVAAIAQLSRTMTCVARSRTRRERRASTRNVLIAIRRGARAACPRSGPMGAVAVPEAMASAPALARSWTWHGAWPLTSRAAATETCAPGLQLQAGSLGGWNDRRLGVPQHGPVRVRQVSRAGSRAGPPATAIAAVTVCGRRGERRCVASAPVRCWLRRAPNRSAVVDSDRRMQFPARGHALLWAMIGWARNAPRCRSGSRRELSARIRRAPP